MHTQHTSNLAHANLLLVRQRHCHKSITGMYLDVKPSDTTMLMRHDADQDPDYVFTTWITPIYSSTTRHRTHISRGTSYHNDIRQATKLSLELKHRPKSSLMLIIVRVAKQGCPCERDPSPRSALRAQATTRHKLNEKVSYSFIMWRWISMSKQVSDRGV